ncbi:MAG: cyclic pyranopterin monophosphate synthase MoaC [Candidatus Zixiibacteriota bacterium]|nr:MAG: cyclic pyranopterin monophosphate synthase MoaC [candidate division Zixibacteria bacterium]
MKKKNLSHVNRRGEARMVDIGGKSESDRRAVAEARILFSRELLSAIKENNLAKGDVLSTARIAGIQAAKKTAELIPLCHTLPLDYVSVEFELSDKPPSVTIRSEAGTHYKTGVEMEALTAAAVAALTVYDMGKAVDRGMKIDYIKLLEKSGGRSGDWKREDD